MGSGVSEQCFGKHPHHIPQPFVSQIARLCVFRLFGSPVCVRSALASASLRLFALITIRRLRLLAGGQARQRERNKAYTLVAGAPSPPSLRLSDRITLITTASLSLLARRLAPTCRDKRK